jgi:hypothetical protein
VSGDNTGGGSGRAEEDAAWRDIVEHYGERITLSSHELGDLAGAESEPAFGDDVDQDFVADPRSYTPAFAPRYDPLDDDSDAFVPPEPPPLPRLPPERLMAWFGVLGVPVVAVVLVVLSFVIDWSPPHWLDAFLVVGFLGGFGYLVLTMPKDGDDDPWDDGARV